MRVGNCAAWLVVIGLILGPCTVAAAPAPGTVIMNKFKSTKQLKDGVLTVSQKLGPYPVPVHVFLTVLGTVRGSGGRAALRTTIAFEKVVHASNSDEFELPEPSLLIATANFDFILSQGQTATVVATSTAYPKDATSPELKLFYKGISVLCPVATVC